MRITLAAGFVVALGLSAIPAGAALDGEALGAKVVGALSKVQSFRLEMSGPAGSGVAGTMTIVLAPAKRLRLVMAGGSVVTESISADGKVYSRINGSPWTVQDISSTASADPGLVQSLMAATRTRALPDRSEDGLTLGVFQTTLAPAIGEPHTAVQQILTCTYDKATFLPRTCADGYTSYAFTGWNDPANAIVVPVAATPRTTPHPK
jgi:hypothetical protein